MSFECCKSGFAWEGQPAGTTTSIASLDTYLARPHASADGGSTVGTEAGGTKHAILIIHDIYGWTFTNTRVLADTYARETGADVYLPDFYHGDIITPETLSDPEKRAVLNLGAFFGKHSKDVRYPEIKAVVQELRRRGYAKIGAVGFCWGGWGVFKLAGREDKAVDFISTAHPSLLVKDDITSLAQPTQVLAPEHDQQFTPEFKALTQQVLRENNIPHEYIDFPGLTHGFAIKGDPNDAKERDGLEKAMRDFINWSNKQFKL